MLTLHIYHDRFKVMAGNRKMLYGVVVILLAGFVLVGVYFGIKGISTKPSVTVALKAERATIKSLTPGEEIVRKKSFQEGKILILSMDYIFNKFPESQDIEIWLLSKGNKLELGATEGPNGMPIPKRDAILSSLKPDYMVFNINSISNKPNTPLKANFYIYFRQKGTLTTQAEIRVKGKVLGKSDLLTIDVN